MHTIFQTLVYQREKGHDAVLATIIWDDGSAPRGRGSQMLCSLFFLRSHYAAASAAGRELAISASYCAWVSSQ